MLIQFVSFWETSSSGTLVNAVKISGILKKTLGTPTGELIISSLDTVTTLHAGRIERRVDMSLEVVENVRLVLVMVPLVRPPWI